MYTAAVLTEMSAQLLKWIMRGTVALEDDGFVTKTVQNNYLPHHMTINLGRFDTSLNRIEVLGSPGILKVDRLIYNHTLGVCAAKVVEATAWANHWKGIEDSIRSSNIIPHITVCIKPDSKPMFANQMLETPGPHNIEVELDEVYELEVRVEEVR